MNNLARIRGSLPQEFHPESTASDLVKIQAIKQVAAKIKDWDLLWDAVDAEIALQSEFVRWWETHVHRKGGERWVDPADPRDQSLPMLAAEIGTGISNQQVSRWRKSIVDAAKYRDKLRLAACRKAGLEPDENHRAEGTGEGLDRGQRRAYAEFTNMHSGNAVFVVNGNATTMYIGRCSLFWEGKEIELNLVNLQALKEIISRWANHARRQLRVIQGAK